jgi:predicted translin family RNA/ssDNA-binding protein
VNEQACTQGGTLKTLKDALSSLREEYLKLKREVRVVAESEVKAAFKAKENAYNLPRQISDHIKPAAEDIARKKHELSEHEKELYEWETSLF